LVSKDRSVATTTIKIISRVGILAAIYAVLTLVPPLNSLSYGPVQIRLAEVLTVLPFFFQWAPWGLYLGCIISNMGSPFLIYDLTLGALATLSAAFMTMRIRKRYLAPLPPVLLNAIIVSFYVSKSSNLPYWLTALYIGLGEAIVCYGLGYPLVLYLEKNTKLVRLLRG
jgi:uncharacterized membrane protein